MAHSRGTRQMGTIQSELSLILVLFFLVQMSACVVILECGTDADCGDQKLCADGRNYPQAKCMNNRCQDINVDVCENATLNLSPS